MARRFMEYLDGRQIDAAALAAYRDEVAPDLNPNTWRGYVHGLNSFLRYLGLDLRLDPPRKVRKEADLLRKDEFLRLLEAAEGQRPLLKAKRDRAILLLMGEAAVRAGEVRSLMQKDLDLERGTAIVRRPKGRHDRMVFFGDATRMALTDYLEARGRAKDRGDEERVFLSAWGRGMIGRNTILAIVHRLSREAGLERRVHPQMFRHMRITELSRQGMNPYQLQRFAGHEDIETTMIYVHVFEDDIRGAMREHPVIPPAASLASDDR